MSLRDPTTANPTPVRVSLGSLGVAVQTPFPSTLRFFTVSPALVRVNRLTVYPELHFDITVHEFEGPYDGKPHTITVKASEGVTLTYSETKDGAYTSTRDISVVRTSQGDGSLSRHAGDGQGHRLAVGQDD